MGLGVSGLSRFKRSGGSGSEFRNGLKDDVDESGVAVVSSAACKKEKISIVSKRVRER